MNSGPETSQAGIQGNIVKECPECGLCYDNEDKICKKDGKTLKIHLRVPRLLSARYLLERRIGQGGMSSVYQAEDLFHNRKVAIKILHMQGDLDSMRRFEREAKTSLTLKHPNIILVNDYGQIDSNGAYLVMELFKGSTLRQLLDRQELISSELAAQWFTQLCEGLKEAHKASVIHRDLKPENIFIARQADGTELIKIFDFGLAKARQPELACVNITAPGTVLGTLGYMPPEQLMGDEVDERSDIFSLAVIVAETLTGDSPFDGITIMQLMASTMQDIFYLKGNTPEILQLNAVLQRAMAKKPIDRYSSVAEFQAELIPAILNYCGEE
jgi:eukaryotic-like serine/threonine-protein kinase